MVILVQGVVDDPAFAFFLDLRVQQVVIGFCHTIRTMVRS